MAIGGRFSGFAAGAVLGGCFGLAVATFGRARHAPNPLSDLLAALREQNGLLKRQIETTAAGARHVAERIDEHRREDRQAAGRPRSGIRAV